MKRVIYTALMATVMSVASMNAMAAEKTTTTTTAPAAAAAAKPAHHVHHRSVTKQSALWTSKDTQILQQSLRDSGFYKGTVTGVWSAQTENALASYQNANGLAVTGTMNDATYKQLGLHTSVETKSATANDRAVKAPRHAIRHKTKAAHKEVTTPAAEVKKVTETKKTK